MWPRKLLFSACLVGLSLGPLAASADELDELKQQLQLLQQRIEKLEAKKASPPAPETSPVKKDPQPPKGATRGKYGVIKISGQINRAVLYADDGVLDGLHHVDNDNSSTRLRISGEAGLTPSLLVGARYELQYESNSSADFTIDQDTASIKNNSFTERRIEAYFKHKRFGTLWLGQGDTASNQTSEKDISGTRVASYSEIGAMGRSLQFRDANTHEQTDNSIGNVFSNFDGLSRTDRLRYDTPSLGGLTLSSSLADNDSWDIAGHYKRKIGSLKIAGGLAYANPGHRDYNQYNGSLSMMHDSGFTLTLAAGQRNLEDAPDGRSNPTFGFIKLGYQFKPNRFGKLALSYDYALTHDLRQEDDEAATHSLAVVQTLDKIGTDLFAGYRRWGLDRPGIDLEDIQVLFAGARVRF